MKRSTERLLASDGTLAVDARLLEQLFDQTPDIVFFIKDRAGRYVVVNRSLVERDGLLQKSQLLGRRACDVFPGVLGRSHSDQDAAVIRTGRPILDHLELHWRRPQRPCWCLTTKLPLRDHAGNVIGLIGFSRDVGASAAVDDIPTGLTRTLAWLEKHFDEQLSPSSLAQRAGLSASRFARFIKRIFGITPLQLIAKTRLAVASRLLHETDRSIAEIALECGFYDHSAFTRAFRSATGQTPTQFRDGAAREV
jgi:AraC-like DNA-binding protein